MKDIKIGRKSLRTSLFSVLTAALILFVFVLNFVLTYFGVQKSMYIDLTTEGLYSLTDAMVRECSFLEDLPEDAPDVKITFCADPDALIESQYTRPTYFMALQLQEKFDNIDVDEINVVYNPTAVAQFEPTSLSSVEPGDVIISYGGRYRIQKPMSFWGGSENAVTSYNGEYVMASCLLSVTSIVQPTAYFVTNHGETYYIPGDSGSSEEGEALYNLLAGRGLAVKTLDLETEDVPDDCVLLVINNPRTDFAVDPDKLTDFNYRSEIEKMDRFMINSQGSIIVARDHELNADGKSVHPILDAFLYDWGFEFTDTVVEDAENHIETTSGSMSTIFGEYSTSKDSFGALVYSNFASLPSAAGVVFKDAGYIKTSYVEGGAFYEAGNSAERMFMSFMDSYSTAVAKVKIDEDGYSYVENSGNLTLAALTGRYHLDGYTNVATRSNIFCVNSKSFFSNQVLGNYSYANHEVMSLLLEQMLFSDRSASMELGGSSMNSENYGGKILDDTSLYVTSRAALEVNVFPVLLFSIPVAVLICGIVVYTKRKYL